MIGGIYSEDEILVGTHHTQNLRARVALLIEYQIDKVVDLRPPTNWWMTTNAPQTIQKAFKALGKVAAIPMARIGEEEA